MIWISDAGVEVDALGTFVFLYVGLIALFAWRIMRQIRAQRVAELYVRERLARRVGLAMRAQRHD